MSFKKTLTKIVTSISLALLAMPLAGSVVQADAVNSNVAVPNTQVATVDAKTQKLDRIVSLAKKQLGKRYVMGATGPNAFDCSGLAMYVYKHAAGKNISRTTYTQVKQGRYVSLKLLRKGDLLFWGSRTAPYHVGIYIGNGQYIHAANPGQGVIKAHLSHYFYPAAAKRIL